MSVYLDASVIVPLFTTDLFVHRAKAVLASRSTEWLVSDFASAEFASVVGNKFRTNVLSMEEARAAFVHFDDWTRHYAVHTETSSADIRMTQTLLRRLDLTLRAPDAVNLATAMRLGAELATFDTKLAECAHSLGISVIRV